MKGRGLTLEKGKGRMRRTRLGCIVEEGWEGWME